MFHVLRVTRADLWNGLALTPFSLALLTACRFDVFVKCLRSPRNFPALRAPTKSHCSQVQRRLLSKLLILYAPEMPSPHTSMYWCISGGDCFSLCPSNSSGFAHTVGMSSVILQVTERRWLTTWACPPWPPPPPQVWSVWRFCACRNAVNAGHLHLRGQVASWLCLCLYHTPPLPDFIRKRKLKYLRYERCLKATVKSWCFATLQKN